jgi:peptide/nickel transport system substrate-binding protein
MTMTFCNAQDQVPLKKGITRRSALRLTALSAGAALLAACNAAGALPSPPNATLAPASAPPAGATATAGQAASVVTSVATPAAKPALQPKSGGTLRSAISVDLSSLEVHGISPPAFENLWTVYERLMFYDEHLQPQPELAESWDVSKDFMQIKINLRRGVVWHNGREFTSDDVKYNILRVRDRSIGGGTFTNQSLWFDTIDTPDKSTIVLGSNRSRPGVYDFLTNFNMVDKDTVEGPDVKSTAIGTGPFSFVEWAPGDHISLTKNKNYWQSGRPYLDAVRVSIVKDVQAMVTYLEAGSLDAIKTPPLLDYVRLRANPAF